MNEDTVRLYKQGERSPDEAFQAAKRICRAQVRKATALLNRDPGRSKQEVSTEIDYAIWYLVELWDPNKANSLDKYIGLNLVNKARYFSRRKFPGPEEVLKEDPDRIVDTEDREIVRELYDLVPGGDKVQLGLMQMWEEGHSYRQSIAESSKHNPEIPRLKIRHTANRLRSRIRSYIVKNYPELLLERIAMSDEETTTTKKTTKKRTTTAKKATAKKADAAPAKTSTKAKKEVAKTSTKAKKEAAKAEGEVVEEEPNAGPPDKDEIEESDLLAKVEEINGLVNEQEAAEVKNDWKIGKHLVDIRSKVADPTWKRVTTELIHGIAGRPLNGSSISKKMKLYNMLPDDESRAVAIGVGRLDKICKLPLIEERRKVIADGCEMKVKGKKQSVPVEKLSCVVLEKWIQGYLEKVHPAKARTPQEMFVSGLAGLARSSTKLMESHGVALKETFDRSQVEAIRAAMNTLKQNLSAIKFKSAAKSEAA